MCFEIAVCDDDVSFLKSFEKEVNAIAERNNFACNLCCYTNGETFLEDCELNGKKYDIIFLDIDMPKVNGKEIASRLQAIDTHFELLFISSSVTEVFRVFSYNMVSYIAKPMLDEMLETELMRTIEICKDKRMGSRKEKQNGWLLLKVKRDKDSSGILKILVQNVAYIESAGGKIFLHTTEKAEKEIRLYYPSFERLKKEMEEYGFIEVHRVCIVNVKHICLLETDTLLLDCGYTVPMSRRRKNYIFQKMTESMTEEKYGK